MISAQIRECVTATYPFSICKFVSGVDPEFFLGGGAPLRNGVTDW